jgi:hypothetical protein
MRQMHKTKLRVTNRAGPWHLFLGREPPPEPFLQRGEDPTEDLLDCGEFAPFT